MEMTPVTSSNITHIGYEPDTQTMRVEFRHGGVYEYDRVPPEAHQALMDAPSIGNHFAVEVKPKFGGVRV